MPNHADLLKEAPTLRCVDGGELTVAWYDGKHCYRCSTCNQYDPETIPAPGKLGLLVKFERGLLTDGLERMMLKNHLNKLIARAKTKGDEPPPRVTNAYHTLEAMMTTGESKALVEKQRREVITQEEADKLTRFVDLSSPKALAELSRAGVDAKGLAESIRAIVLATGLDPRISGELTVYEGKPWVGTNGLYKIISNQENFVDYDESHKWLSAAEREDQGIDPKVFIACKIGIRYVKTIMGHQQILTAWGVGKASRTMPHRNNAVEKDYPERFAEGRAVRQAFRKVYQATLSGLQLNMMTPEVEGAVNAGVPLDAAFEEQDDSPEAMEGEFREVTEQQPASTAPEGQEQAYFDEDGHPVDQSTGEILTDEPPKLTPEQLRQKDKEDYDRLMNPDTAKAMVPDPEGDWRDLDPESWWERCPIPEHMGAPFVDQGPTKGVTPSHMVHGVWCNRKGLLNAVWNHTYVQYWPDSATAEKQSQDWLREHFEGRTKSTMQDKERVQAIQLLRQMLAEKEGAPF